MTQPTVRDARLDDLETIVSFNAALALATERLTLDPDQLASGVRRVLQDPQAGRYFVAETPENDIVGQCMLTHEWSDWRNGWIWWFQSVYVAPEHRKRGVFRTLYQHVESLAQRNPDVVGLRLYVEKDNRSAMQTYEALGMQPSGHIVYERPWSADSNPIAGP